LPGRGIVTWHNGCFDSLCAAQERHAERTSSSLFRPFDELVRITHWLTVERNNAVSRLPSDCSGRGIGNNLRDVQMELWLATEADKEHHDEEGEKKVHQCTGAKEDGTLPAWFVLEAVWFIGSAVFADDTDESAKRDSVEGIEHPTSANTEETWRETDAELEDTNSKESGGEEVAEFMNQDENGEDRDNVQRLHRCSLSRAGNPGLTD
jgi:hypothetical protein